MQLICPKCTSPIDSINVNIKTDLAKCEKCHSLHKVSQLANKTRQAPQRKPPAKTKIKLQKLAFHGVKIQIPSAGFRLVHIPIMGFSAFWLGFVAFWTVGAAQGSILFAMFSIPFWIAGITMWVGIINSITESQTLTLQNKKLILSKKSPLKNKKYNLQLTDIQDIRLSELHQNNRNNSIKQLSQGSNKSAMIITTSKNISCFEYTNEVEQEWLVEIVKLAMDKQK